MLYWLYWEIQDHTQFLNSALTRWNGSFVGGLCL